MRPPVNSKLTVLSSAGTWPPAKRVCRFVFTTLISLLSLVTSHALADDEWQLVPVPGRWSEIPDTNLGDYDGTAWYRAFVVIPKEWSDSELSLSLGKIDDVDQTFFNGEKIGETGTFPPNSLTAWNQTRRYSVPASLVRPGQANLIAVRVHDSGGAGGITEGPLHLRGPNGVLTLGGGTWLFRTGDSAEYAKWNHNPADPLANLVVRQYLSSQGPGAIAPGNGILISGKVAAPSSTRSLWYQQPATTWTEALPVGNGRLGAMVHGDPQTLHLQLNEESLWAGKPIERDRPGAAEAFREARALMVEGKIIEAQRLLQEKFMTPRRIRSHQTLGDLRFHSPRILEAREYQRSLDLATGIATTEFQSGETRFVREVFASAPHDVIIVRISSDRPGQVTGTLSLDRPGNRDITAAVAPQQLLLAGRAQHQGKELGVQYQARVQVETSGGQLVSKTRTIEIRDADSVVFVITAATDYGGKSPQSHNVDTLSRLTSYDTMRRRHLEDHSKLFDRVSIDLGETSRRKEPTDLRLQAVREGRSDPDLIATYFQFGRYLLMGSSRPGTLPANLQGLWNHHLEAPWNADYHININLQMNYWPAEVTALSECHLPLFDYLDRLRVRGQKTAEVHYDAPGWVAHHTSDIWAFTAPIGRTVWGLWPYGGAWLCRHLWEHYQYTGDEDFLRDRAWPALEGACQFHLANLFPDPESGKLIAGPSSSPENSFRTSEGRVADVGIGNSVDLEIIADLFDFSLKTIEVLDLETPLKDRLLAARSNLALPKIGDDGRILEWRLPYEEVEPGHRHFSHLYGLHPAELWTADIDRERFAAARKSLETRLAHGGGHTGWSRAWLVSQWARLGEGEKVSENLDLLLAKSTHINLFDDHPPFQIDGNFGGTAGVAEALMQSHGGVLRLLPALPSSWKNGSITGLRTRQGIEVDLSWKEGALKKAVLTPSRKVSVKVIHGEKSQQIDFEPGKAVVIDAE